MPEAVVLSEDLLANTCKQCPVNELPENEREDAIGLALFVRIHMNHGGDLPDPESHLRTQARQLNLTDQIGAYKDLETHIKAAIDCGRCRFVGECPVQSLVTGIRDDSESNS